VTITATNGGGTSGSSDEATGRASETGNVKHCIKSNIGRGRFREACTPHLYYNNHDSYSINSLDTCN